ncbi:hypothetical protein DSO57_1020684 [Entomophthora muscae]|uniref:Uncharacterized protein n=1 Tax=Entomophthora muscae TaxID=34485 RepID=A0ACC2U1X8_9FUNG|nr:hypothetical protein DSO57_1020684 [Entomophthora muscae]
MQIISFISVVLHFSLGVDASPIGSSASLVSTSPDALLFQRADQSLALKDKDPDHKGVTLSRRSEPITKNERDQQEKPSGKIRSFLKRGTKAVAEVIKFFIKEQINEHKDDFFKDLDTLIATGKKMLSKPAKKILEQAEEMVKEKMKRFLLTLLEEEKTSTPGNTREKTEAEVYDPKKDAETIGIEEINKVPSPALRDSQGERKI